MKNRLFKTAQPGAQARSDLVSRDSGILAASGICVVEPNKYASELLNLHTPLLPSNTEHLFLSTPDSLVLAELEQVSSSMRRHFTLRLTKFSLLSLAPII